MYNECIQIFNLNFEINFHFRTPKFDKEEDPEASLMTLMKQMYEDGDDDMKRTIAKAWTEARDKKTPEDML